jgi:hypothetical protein
MCCSPWWLSGVNGGALPADGPQVAGGLTVGKGWERKKLKVLENAAPIGKVEHTSPVTIADTILSIYAIFCARSWEVDPLAR